MNNLIHYKKNIYFITNGTDCRYFFKCWSCEQFFDYDILSQPIPHGCNGINTGLCFKCTKNQCLKCHTKYRFEIKNFLKTLNLF